ncbi:MAG TPA: PAS domain S-box protein, partial [Bacteroidota bacterium]|nr:PAS domain S-box protein [Bacteroidota bacterium]
FRTLANTTPAAIFTYGEKFTYVNPAAESLTGYTSAELLGMNFWEIVHPDNREFVRHRKQARLRGEDVPNRYEFKILRKDGASRWIEFSSGMFKPNGKAYAIGTAFDITERKLYEERLRNSELLYKDLVENSNEVTYLLDRRLQLRYISPVIQQKTGYAPAELLGRLFADVIVPDDVEIVKEQFRAALSGGTMEPVEFRFKTTGGKTLWARASVVPVMKEGRLESIRGVAIDITEQKLAMESLKASEERFRMLTETASSAIIIYQGEDLRYVNKAAERLLGYSAEELLSKRFWDVIHSEEQNAVRERGLARQRGEQVPTRTEVRIVTKAGEIRWVDFTAAMIQYDGEPAVLGTAFDITDRKQAEDAVRKSEQRFRIVSEKTGQLIYDYDVSSGVIHWSGAIEYLTGYSLEEFDSFNIGKWEEHIHPDDRMMALHGLDSSMNNRTPYHVEYRFRRKDGQYIIVEDNGAFLYDADGKAYRMLGTMSDVTERKQAEVALRESEAFRRLIVEAEPECVKVVAADGTLIDMNPAGLKMIEAESLEAVRGKSIVSLVTPRFKPAFTALHERVLQGESGKLEFEIVGMQGTHRWLETHAVPLRGNSNKVEALLAVTRDVTERKRAQEALAASERRYREIFEEDLTGNFISTPDGRIHMCNKRFATIFGYASIEEVLQTPVEEYYARPGQREEFLTLLRRMKKLEHYEEVARRKDGTLIHIIENVIGKFDAEDNLVEIHGYVFDVTEQRKLEQQLRHAQKMESIGTLAGGIAHDFNNILGIILGHVSLVERGVSREGPAAQSLDAITKAIHRGAGLVRQLLTFARKSEVEMESMHINEVVRETVKMLKETFPKTIVIETRLDDRLPLMTADTNQIHQVLLNLCVNSRDAMPTGGVLRIATGFASGEKTRKRFPQATGSSYITVEVADSGMGISPELRTKIFEPFFTTKEKGKGTGLGLSTVYGIVGNHNGFIDLESEMGKGTVFTMYFPTKEQMVSPGEVGLRQVASESYLGSETILVVEDEEMLRGILQMFLESNGYKVICAEDGEEALELFRDKQHEIGLVLSDMGLPKISGGDLFRRIKLLNPEVRFILATGYVESELKSELLGLGVFQVIQKPYQPTEILRTLRQILDRPGKNIGR